MSRVVRTVVVVLIVVGGAATYGARAWFRAHAIPEQASDDVPARLARIPLEAGDPPFVGTRETLEPRIADLSGADHYAAIDYRRSDREAVRLHVGVSVESDGWLHEPTSCLPGQGWVASETALVPLWEGLAGSDPAARMWRMHLRKPDQRLLVYYWFQWGDRIVTSRSDRAWRRFRGLLAGERDRPVQIVIFYTPIEQSEERSAARIESLARAVWPSVSAVLREGK
jgi:EpsI family protein